MGKRLQSFERAAGKGTEYDFDGMELAQGSKCTEETVSQDMGNEWDVALEA
jgi:hypothetical protein